jgi:hypothetical protein
MSGWLGAVDGRGQHEQRRVLPGGNATIWPAALMTLVALAGPYSKSMLCQVSVAPSSVAESALPSLSNPPAVKSVPSV